MSADVWYLDTSALVKTVVAEPESRALLRWLRRKKLVACELVRVEAVRAVRGSEPRALPRVRRAVRALNLIRLEDDLYDAAVELEPPELRSLDAIHLAAALSLGPDLAGVVTYDRRLALRANGLGIRVKAPTRG
jgi:uncharacterized protein